MPDREKVIKGLEMCIKDIECTGCPYEGECFDENDDRQFGENMMRDALALLKEHVARVLTIDEALNLKKGDEIWIEYTGCHNKLFMLTISRVRRFGLTFFNHLPCPWEYYGKKPETEKDWSWRIWTDRPTNEQRMEMNWNG